MEATRTRCTRQHPPANLASSNAIPPSHPHTTNGSTASGLVTTAPPPMDDDTTSIARRGVVNASSDPATAGRLFPTCTSNEGDAHKNAAVTMGVISIAVKPAHAMAYRVAEERLRHRANPAAVTSASSPPCQTK